MIDYQCAEDFRNHPEDLSWMYIKLQEFLTNPHIIFRWYLFYANFYLNTNTEIYCIRIY